MTDISVVICTHNPRMDYLEAVLASIFTQDPLPPDRSWELLLIDNASSPPIDTMVKLEAANVRVIKENKLGLTHARVRSFKEANGRLIVYVDDDNVLKPNYLRTLFTAFEGDPELGALGGKVLPRFEVPPPQWFSVTGIDLACRDLGDNAQSAIWDSSSTKQQYPACAPVGAGMAIRREAYATYVEGARNDPMRLALGRKGADLASGEDNDMILTLLENGWRVGYLPQLSLDHLIPAKRLTESYLCAYSFSSNRTWVQVLGSAWDVTLERHSPLDAAVSQRARVGALQALARAC